MSAFKKSVVATVIAASVSSVSFAFNMSPTAPSGWTLKLQQPNVIIAQRGNEQTYVQVVDVQGGAKVRSIYAQVGTGNSFTKNILDTWWNNYGGSSTRVSMVNGQFFNNGGANPTTLSFAVRAGSVLRTSGASSIVDEPNANMQVEIRDNVGASVVSKNATTLNNGPASEIIVSFGGSTPKNTGADARTYMCTKTKTNAPWLFIISTQSKTHENTLQDLESWGCPRSNVLILDGGGSTQLQTVNGIRMNKGENRSIPHAIAVYNNGTLGEIHLPHFFSKICSGTSRQIP